MALSDCAAEVSSQGLELAERGTPMFPIACYYDDLSAASVPWHWHDEMEAFLVAEGRAVAAAEGRQVSLGPGDGVFVNGGVLHAVWNDGSAVCRLHSIVFHPRLVGGGIDTIFWQRYVQPLLENKAVKLCPLDGSAPWHGAAAQAVEAAWQSVAGEAEGYEFLTREELSRLVLLLTKAYPLTDAAPSEKAMREDGRIKQMLRFIHEHYGESLSVGAIAKAAAVGESECLRCFRHAINVPPIEYLTWFRLQKAAELLASTELKAADIGGLCGFQDASYFTKTFRAGMGCTPTEYRKRAARP